MSYPPAQIIIWDEEVVYKYSLVCHIFIMPVIGTCSSVLPSIHFYLCLIVIFVAISFLHLFSFRSSIQPFLCLSTPQLSVLLCIHLLIWFFICSAYRWLVGTGPNISALINGGRVTVTLTVQKQEPNCFSPHIVNNFIGNICYYYKVKPVLEWS